MASETVRIVARGDTQLFPFEEPPARLPLLDVPLRFFQQRELFRAGLPAPVDVPLGEPLPGGAKLAFFDDAVFTAATLQALVDEAAAARAPRRAAVAHGTPLFDFVAPLFGARVVERDLALPLWAGDLGGRILHDDDEAALAVVCDEGASDDVRVAPLGRPPHMLRVPRCARIGGRLAHWLHLLNLNHAVLVAERERLGAVGSKNVREGRAEIHPSALVEGSLLGDRVVIEHSASVLRSFLGEGVRVADHAVLVDCVIGPRCHTLVDTHMRRVVALGGSTLSNLGVEDLLLGRQVFITTGVAFFQEADGESVVVDGEDTRRPALAGAVGDRAVLGARALFRAGAAVPAGTVIVMRPDEGASKLDDNGLARAHMQRGDPARDH